MDIPDPGNHSLQEQIDIIAVVSDERWLLDD
jgi:hypothetical protein